MMGSLQGINAGFWYYSVSFKACAIKSTKARILAEHFRGNVQYLSVGTLNANDKVSIILMDYANHCRLKIWGRVRIVHEQENPELIAALEDPTCRASIERAMVITVEA